MAMTWLQQMFTPERSGSYEWQGRPDQGGGEFTGEQRDAQGNITYEGDEQYLTFVPRANRGPGNMGPPRVAPTVGQKMPDVTNATEGMGQNATQDMMDAVRATGLGGNYDSGGMDNVEDVNIQIEESMTMPSSSMGPDADVGMTNIAESMKMLGMGGGGGMQGFKPGGALTRMGPNEGGMRAIRGGGMLPAPSGGAMAKVNPSAMRGMVRQPAMMSRGGVGGRPNVGFDAARFNQATKTPKPVSMERGFNWRDLLRFLPAGVAGGLLEPESGSYRPVRSTGIRGLNDPNWGGARRRY